MSTTNRVRILVCLALVALIVTHRQRIYVRVPMASVYSDGVKQAGVQVFVNYSYDVLLEKDSQPGAYRILVQGWSKMPGTPTELNCLRWMACLTDANHAAMIPMFLNGSEAYNPQVTMTKDEVSFVNRDGATVRVAFYRTR